MDSSPELLRSLAEAVPDALWLIGLDGRTVYANDNLARLLGRDPSELAGLHGADVADTQGRADFEHHLELMRAGHPGESNEEVLVLRGDGSTVWCLVTWTPMRDDSGHLMGYLHRLTEYTERRRLVQTIQQSRQQLAEAQRLAHIGSWTWDVVNDRVEWSDELYRIYGDEERAFGGTYEAFLTGLHVDDRPAVEESIRVALSRGESFTWEGRVIRPDGEVRWLRGLGLVECDATGRVIASSGTAQDTTDLYEAAERAAAATRRLQILQRVAEAANRSDTLLAALVRCARTLDTEGGWLPVAAWLRGTDGHLHSVELPEPAGVPLIEPDAARAATCWRTGEISVHPVHDHSLVSLPVLLGGEVTCVVQLDTVEADPDAPTWDLLHQVCEQLGRVADREHAAVLLEEARDEAMAASRHKSEFLAMMSHEIRTPMNGVLGLNDLLLKSDLSEGQRRLAEGLRGSGLTLLTLLNDILDLSKIESGRLELETAEFDAGAVFDQVATLLAGEAHDKGIELVVGVDPVIPHWLVGDQVRLGQVLTNLGANAIKFTDRGEVVIDARLDPGSLPDDDGVILRVEVRDTGIGLDSATADSLFEAFNQADVSTTRRHGGTGLGLTISRRLVEMMGGEIGVTSSPGLGSTFWFTVRLRRARSLLVDLGRPLADRTVLVVDDNETTTRFAERRLVSWGMQVDRLTEPARAVQLMLERARAGTPFEVALIDFDMPGIDGFGLASLVRREPELAGVRLVLVATDPESRSDAIAAAGFDAWTAKPVLAPSLQLALLQAVIGEAPTAAATHRPSETSIGGRLLVVEDNRVNQLVATGLLEGLGCAVDVVDDGIEATQALAPGHPYDLVLMDCRMPRLDGYDATRRIRIAETAAGVRRVPVVALTASALAGEHERCAEAGMDDFLTKPIDPGQLAAVLRRWLGSSPTPPDAAAVDPPAPEQASRSAAGAAEGPAVLDPERVEMLAELVKDGVSFFERTRMSFLARIDVILADLRVAVADGDTARTAATAHQLKGSALNLGLQRVGAAAATLERGAATSSPGEVEAQLATLGAEVRSGVEALIAVDTTAPSTPFLGSEAGADPAYPQA